MSRFNDVAFPQHLLRRPTTELEIEPVPDPESTEPMLKDLPYRVDPLMEQAVAYLNLPGQDRRQFVELVNHLWKVLDPHDGRLVLATDVTDLTGTTGIKSET